MNEREKEKMEKVYICEKCKEVVWESDLKTVEGDDCVCPCCGGSSYYLNEAVKCSACGEYVLEDESYDGYCENCIDKAATPENLIEWCDIEDETEFLEVNSAVASMCRELKIDINDLLKEVINESVYKDRVLKACQESVKQEFDTEYFMKWWKNRG